MLRLREHLLLVPEVLFSGLPVVNILIDTVQTLRSPIFVVSGLTLANDPATFPRRPPNTELDREGFTALDWFPLRFDQGLVFRMDQPQPVFVTAHAVGQHAVNLLALPGTLQSPRDQIQLPQAELGTLLGQREASLTFSQLQFRLLAERDVLIDAGEFYRPASPIVVRAAPGIQPVDAAIGPAHAKFGVDQRTL